MVEDLFIKFEKQSSTKVAWGQHSFMVQLQSNKAYLLNYFWHWSFLSNINQQLKIIISNLLFVTFQFVFDSQWHKLTCRAPWLLKHCWYERAKARHKGVQGVFSRASKGLPNRQNIDHVANFGISYKHNLLIWGMIVVNREIIDSIHLGFQFISHKLLLHCLQILVVI